MTLKTVIAEDEPVARQGMERLVRQTGFLTLTGVARHSAELTELLNRSAADLLLLDIEMPGDTGMEWLRTRSNPPIVIFTTAYAQHALAGFELNAVDYLLKPVTAERFSQAAGKALELFLYRHPLTTDALPSYIFVRENRQQRKIALDDILYIEGMLNYVIIHTDQRHIITYISMKNILGSLPATRFLQVHRSYIVSLDKIRNVGKNGLDLGRHQVPVSRLYKPALDNWLRGKQLL